MDIGHVLFRLQGRIGQQDYWIGILILFGLHMISGVFGPLGPILWIGLIWLGIAIYGKRLHDAGRSAWIHAIPWAIFVGMWIVAGLLLAGAGAFAIFGSALGGGELPDDDIFSLIAIGSVGMAIIGLSYLVWIVYTIWVGLLPSDTLDNAYGPVPGGDGSTAASASAASASAGAPLVGEGGAPSKPHDAPKS